MAIERAAADWIARRDRGFSRPEAVEFAAWERADPRHADELRRLGATWRALDTADEIPEIMRLAHELEAQVNAGGVRQVWRARTIVAMGLAAALAVGATVFWRSAFPNSDGTAATSRSYKVVPSVAQRLTLVDGSIVHLKEGSAVEPAFSASERRVRLVQGEARFEVAHEAGRPFVVHVGNIAVRAVGTAFNVIYTSDVLEVLVTEGKVRIDDDAGGRSLLERVASAPLAAGSGQAPSPDFPVLGAGERVVMPPDARIAVAPQPATAVELERALAWHGTQLVFDRTPLAEAVSAFNSFNREQITLGDTSLAARQLGGTFRADSVEAFVRLLESGFEITAERRGDREIVLHRSRGAAR